MTPAPAAITLGTTIAGKPLVIPIDVATESVAIIARKGAGKTYTGRVLAEDLLDRHVQVVVVDPLDVWWGLRLGAGGAAGGCNVVIFGGSHADLPLVETAGKALADLVIDRGISAVLVVDDLSLAGQRRFVADFGEQLFERKRAQEHRTPVHVIIDEADSFAPQRVPPEGTRCAGVIDRMVRRGRSRGIGTTAISQRPAVLNKDVLTQTEVLITLQVTSPQDRAALTEWVKANADAEQAKAYLDSLAGLQRGQAWVWSPSRLQVFERIQVRKVRTFDSSYTPKVGESRPATPRLRPVELDALREELAGQIKAAADNDPAQLRKRIAAIERELAAAVAATKPVGPSPAELADARASGYDAARGRYQPVVMDLVRAIEGALPLLVAAARAAAPLFTEGALRAPPATSAAPAPPARAAAPPPRAPARPSSAVRAGDATLGKAERLVLTALAQYPAGRTRVQAALLAGYAHNGGGFKNALGSLRSSGWITGAGDQLVATAEGLAALGSFEPLPHGPELLDHWLRQLGKAERAVLQTLYEAWPKAVNREEVATAAGYEADGGGFKNALGRLRTLELISGRGDLKASDDLMVDG